MHFSTYGRGEAQLGTEGKEGAVYWFVQDVGLPLTLLAGDETDESPRASRLWSLGGGGSDRVPWPQNESVV